MPAVNPKALCCVLCQAKGPSILCFLVKHWQQLFAGHFCQQTLAMPGTEGLSELSVANPAQA